MYSIAGSTGQPPDQVRVDVTEQQVTRLSPGTRSSDVVQNPADFWTGEVRREWQTCLVAKAVLACITRQFVDDLIRAGVLPDDGVVDRPAGATVPHDGGLALVGDAHRGDLVAPQSARVERGADDRLRALPDLYGVVLDPSRTRIDLGVLLLGAGDDLAGVIEDHASSAGGALVDRRDVRVHGVQRILSRRKGGTPNAHTWIASREPSAPE